MTLKELRKNAADAVSENDCHLSLNPAVVLKLLDMIDELREGITEEHHSWEDDNPPEACHSQACRALVRVAEIEQGLTKLFKEEPA